MLSENPPTTSAAGDLLEQPVSRVLNAAAAAQPTPGGGSIAALAGALATAMARMAANYTAGRKRFADRESDIRALLKRLDGCDFLFRRLVQEDIEAYGAVDAALRRRDDDPERPAVLAEALRRAIAVPAEMTAIASTLVRLCDEGKERVNPRLLSDLGVAAELGAAVARAAALNVRVNLVELRDEAEARARREELARQLEHVDAALQRIRAYLAERF